MKGSVRSYSHLGVNPNTPCQHSLWEETGIPGENPRLSVEGTLFTQVLYHVSRVRIEHTVSEVKGAFYDDAPPKTQKPIELFV